MEFRLAEAISVFALVSATWSLEEDLDAFGEHPEPRGLSAKTSSSVEVYRIPLDRPMVEGLVFGVRIEFDTNIKDAKLTMTVGQEVGDTFQNFMISFESDIRQTFVAISPKKADQQVEKSEQMGIGIYDSEEVNKKPGPVYITYLVKHPLERLWGIEKGTGEELMEEVQTHSYGNVLRVVAKKITIKHVFHHFDKESTLLPVKPESLPVSVSVEFDLRVLPLFDKTRSYSIAFIDPLPSNTLNEAPFVLKSDHRVNQHTVSCFSHATKWTQELPAALPRNTKVGDILVFKFVRAKPNEWQIFINGSIVATYTTCAEIVKLIKISPELQLIQLQPNVVEPRGFKPVDTAKSV